MLNYTFKNLLFRIIRPNFWILLYPYNKSWDEFILNSLKITHPKVIDRYEIELNGRIIWASNYPYGFGTPRNSMLVRPSATTIKKLRDSIVIV